MLNYFSDNICVQFGGRLFQQTIGIPIGANVLLYLPICFNTLIRHTFLKKLLRSKARKLAQPFISSFRYADDVLLLNNIRFCDYLNRNYPNELEVKDTTDTQKSASSIENDNGGRLKTKL